LPQSRALQKGYECIGALGCSAVGVLRNQYAESLAALLIALREFHFECIEEQLDEQNELRARGTDMTELPTARRLLLISFLFISQNGGNICLRKTSPFFLFGRGLRATPLGPSTPKPSAKTFLLEVHRKFWAASMIGTQSGAIGRNEMKITAERRPQNGGFCG
jgi:hypothetical protein